MLVWPCKLFSIQEKLHIIRQFAGGGIPILLAGTVVGGVGVSGLPEADDVRLARLGADALAEH